MKALVLSNGKLKEQEIDGTLEELQSIVCGYIEIPYLSKEFNENGIDVVINEDGKFIEGLRPELAVVDSKTKKILDVIMGNCVFVSHDEIGNTIGLNDKQMKIIMQELQMDATLTYQDKNKEYTAKILFA